MTWLIVILHLFIGATLSGVLIVAGLVAGVTTPGALLIAAALGFALAFPVSWLIARRIGGSS